MNLKLEIKWLLNAMGDSVVNSVCGVAARAVAMNHGFRPSGGLAVILVPGPAMRALKGKCFAVYFPGFHVYESHCII